VAGRTFAVGDIHGDLAALQALFARVPQLAAGDTVVFLGDYIDRGPDSAGVVKWLRDFAASTAAKVVFLRGNHEDAWLQIIEEGWLEFLLPRGNGCLESYRSFKQLPAPTNDDLPTPEEMDAMLDGSFFPAEIVEWMKSLEWFYEDEHAIYVHAGLKRSGDHFPHPSRSNRRARSCGCATATFSRTTAASSSCSATPPRARCQTSCRPTRPMTRRICGPGRRVSGSTPRAVKVAF